jgi:hypothetical protein
MYTPTIGARTCNVAAHLFSGQLFGPTAPNNPRMSNADQNSRKRFLWLLLRRLELSSCTNPITIDLYA